MAPPSSKDRLALVADESPFGQAVARTALARTGIYRVLATGSGAEALTAFADAKPDLLVLDWDIPVISAREIVEAARDEARSYDPLVPVVLLMAEPTRSVLATLAGFRINAVLARPFSLQALVGRLASLTPAAA